MSTADLRNRYFAERSDGLEPAHGEPIVVATVRGEEDSLPVMPLAGAI